MNASEIALAVSVFAAAAVEMVEAVTIVLAMGLTRGWRSTLIGSAVALGALVVTALVLGYALVEVVPEALLQLVVGTLLLIFGLQWLRKAILRSAGLKAQHDEAAIFAREVQEGQQAAARTEMGLDWFAFVVSFKGVYLEGIEVLLIVLTFGLSAHNVPVAVVGAVLAVVVVGAVATVARRPLSQVPENTIKFGVGVLLSTFGTFWTVEGLGVFAPGQESLEWPFGDVTLLLVLVGWLALARGLVAYLSRPARTAAVPA